MKREAEEADRKRKAKEARLRRYLNEKTMNDDLPNPRESIAERLKKRQ